MSLWLAVPRAVFVLMGRLVGAEKTSPTLDYEERAWAAGYRRIAGLDEAGRGAWAGPVVAAAVILPPPGAGLLESLHRVRDSKQLTPVQRELLLETICEQAVAVGVGAVLPAEIDAWGIVAATRRAMSLALAALSPPADFLLIDYLTLPDELLPQVSLPKGDARVLSIAAASIVAKVKRDRLMVALDACFPGYGFAQHKGYGTAAHQVALASLGACHIHRFSFRPVQRLANAR